MAGIIIGALGSLLGTPGSGSRFVRVIILVSILLLLSAVWAQRLKISGLNAINIAQARQLEEMNAINAGLALFIEESRAEWARERILLAEHAGQLETLAGNNRNLERRLKKALANEYAFSFDTVLPDAVIDALCLRWYAASGHSTTNNQTDSSRATDAGASDPATSLCSGWRGAVDMASVIEWTGFLLDHAGQERVDKAALRLWSISVAGGDKNND